MASYCQKEHVGFQVMRMGCRARKYSQSPVIEGKLSKRLIEPLEAVVIYVRLYHHPPPIRKESRYLKADVVPPLLENLTPDKPFIVAFLRSVGCPSAEKTFRNPLHFSEKHGDACQYVAITHIDQKRIRTTGWKKLVEKDKSKQSAIQSVKYTEPHSSWACWS